MKKNVISYHPFIIFIYFFIVMMLSMFLMHPALLILSIIYASTLSFYINGMDHTIKIISYSMMSILIVSISNPLFNHQGATILYYFKNQNPLTLESILFGISSGSMLVSSIIWFSCYNKIMTSEKIIFLLSKVTPTISLILSMAMRFIPRYKEQIDSVANTQKCIGKDINSGSVLQKIKNSLSILSITTTWAFENSIETSNSMISRGYGASKRSSYSIYHFSKKDIIVLTSFFVICISMLLLKLKGAAYVRYFPTTKFSFDIYTIIFLICFSLIALFPIIDIYIQNYVWNKKLSKSYEEINPLSQFNN